MKRTAEDIIESETDCHKVLKLSIDAAIAAKLSIPVETKEKEEEDEELMITVDISSCIDQKEDEVSKLTDLDVC